MAAAIGDLIPAMSGRGFPLLPPLVVASGCAALIYEVV
jgi:hypothetical protein